LYFEPYLQKPLHILNKPRWLKSILKRLSSEKVESAKVLLRQGKSTSEVARELDISISSAIRIREGDRENIPEPKMGRPSLVSPTTKRVITREIDTGKLRTIQEVQQYIKSAEQVHVGIETARRYVKSEGLKNYVRPFKPRLTKSRSKKGKLSLSNTLTGQ
ncbi:hypothetical protein BGX26_007047, partial [Mortierella sp. AD094]